MEEKRIGVEIKTLANLIGRHLNEISCSNVGSNLTGPQGLFLCYLYEHQDKDIFQKDLEASFNIRRSSATGLLRCLEDNGFIKRESVDYDARLKKIILTQKAFEFKDLLEKHIYQMEQTLTKNLEPEEIDEFIRIIGKIKKNLE
ncbi:MarR family transcriptional regulator [Thomasclavelia sp.]|uniref:MarR family winged helix-turn-helix transcriptional regulator n=1 Tax=Thomasclavelia sp. TaxID=3025757 RepID=UPI0025D28417|nr:MarR family transcriptional regulator [Thomasclavelia sp.]